MLNVPPVLMTGATSRRLDMIYIVVPTEIFSRSQENSEQENNNYLELEVNNALDCVLII